MGFLIFLMSGIVNDVRTYFQSSTDLFYIPNLLPESVKIN